VSRAVCPRCGADRLRYSDTCPSCGHRPVDDGLLIAWLLSSEHLSDAQLDAAKQRIAEGGTIQPSKRQLRVARRALGRTFDSDPGLSLTHRTLLLATSLVLTPLPAWACFAWWLNTRPKAAWQSFGVALPGSVLYFALGVWLALRPWFGAIAARLDG
jgi:hypothetical protein